MKLSGITPAVLLLAMTVAISACGTQDGGAGGGSTTSKRVIMDERQATKRAEGIIHQAVDAMSPKPTLKRTPLKLMGSCLAGDDHGSDDRVQLRLSYQLTGVPGSEAKSLVRQARDAWVQQGYKYQSRGADWSDPFPTVSMRTEPDDFWMTALTGVLDKSKGEGLAAITVTSPCFSPGGDSTADTAVLRSPHTDGRAARRALDRSSRIYDALQACHFPTAVGVPAIVALLA
ncbi:hypothetical protein [Streptomyces fagopyri]|uniref:hypothetical protein n=1 Tax=Streptomyces fagopyri TaxID=2662397 RepID=UPI0038066C46